MKENDEQKATPLDYASPRQPPVVPLYRRILAGIVIIAGGCVGVLGFFVSNEAARFDTWFAAGCLVIVGLVIRFQHVRL